MAFRTFGVQDMGRLTDVQLIHKLDAAIAAREADAASPGRSRAERLLRFIPPRAPWLASLVLAAVQVRDGVEGAWLAVRVASTRRLSAWASASEARLAALDADIRIMALLGEMERRVARSGGAGLGIAANLRRG
jgi:hypothetical protein